ncbi:MAG: hypothetical protein KatS3mg081_0013 [Gemmatimonadales bacterium]|nr:MAG: hypothetical protein KatS3mg081_0013 [Gemmatimonadales bacterium]
MPEQTALDGGFASKENLREAKALGVVDVCFSNKLGLTVHEMTRSSWLYTRLRDLRADIEGLISFLKRVFGLSRCPLPGRGVLRQLSGRVGADRESPHPRPAPARLTAGRY